ncbi:hypothetical protein MY11210_000743 [Beauveria gryllotalpidicola]
MLVAATAVFVYYTVWTLMMVRNNLSCLPLRPGRMTDYKYSSRPTLTFFFPAQPFVDDDHPLQNFFLPRVWAIRIPVILILLGSAVVGSFLGMVMIRSNRKKAAKAKAAVASKKKA